MARSKVKGTNGKPVKAGKNRQKLQASVKFAQQKDGNYKVTKRDDGDPTITTTTRDRRKTLRGPDKVTKKTVTKTRDSKRETAASKKSDKDWQKAPAKVRKGKKPIMIGGKPMNNTQGYTGSRGTKLPARGTSGRPKAKYEQESYKETKTTRTPTKKKNPNYNKKDAPSRSYSDKAKRPGGHILGIPKTEKMSEKEARKYKRYLEN
jgi:hypothetical protein